MEALLFFLFVLPATELAKVPALHEAPPTIESLKASRANVIQIISVSNAGPWGDWGLWDSCPQGSYANGFRMKVEPQHVADETSVNSICLECVYADSGLLANRPCSKEGPWGDWRGPYNCPIIGNNRSYIVGFALKNQEESLIGDETAINNMQALCRTFDGTSGITMIEGIGNTHGTYTTFSDTCPIGSGVCAILTRVEPDRGIFVDDTALNDAQLACCTL
ncbi:vitelline membrane outer layer protein 1 homolog [Artemia franciscana]|uniref:Vitelline membrane outer layer protein 1 n=1 Tax=Artemia franciscana TaxID=6661 RepID=A0AA88HH85_ARTSF|nr:hypothetical protein QYM36_017355 [Artemia franciscana]